MDMFNKRRLGSTGGTDGTKASTKETGAAGEERALAHLRRHGLTLVERNYRVARGPSRRAGEVDLIMRDADGTLVFVEVRARAGRSHGGAAGSVTGLKQRRVIYAAQHYLMRMNTLPPCRFDVVSIEGDELQWLVAAFDAG
ncbi:MULTISPECIES: YraN family protein [Aquincola]|uniref:YraN family protein n=1 Tax=Aquincola TaxID=391952 RepID=UPI0035C0A6A2